MSSLQVIHALRKDSQKKRVAGYARVSTADEHQDSSYRLQIQELEESIRLNPKYEFIGVFKDRKSGRNTRARQEFSTMIELAFMGEIDIIITKSITRFARNLVDTISIVRELKIQGIEVRFQKEGISTLDPSIEMILTVLAMHAEEESKNISDNTRWSFQRKMRAGGNFTSYLYGYYINKDKWTINKSEASVVRLIFDMYLNNFSYRQISERLFDLGIKTSSGKDRWMKGTIEQMLKNEKYAGHMALGKTYIVNGVAVRSTRLDIDNSMIMNHHVPIIKPGDYERAMNKRKERAGELNCTYLPREQRTSPYYLFVYSLETQKHLYYRVERPKNKYEIPTLFSYDKNRENRVMITVNNLFILLNNALGKLAQQAFKFNAETLNLIDEKLNALDIENGQGCTLNVDALIEKASLNKAKNKLLNFTKKLKNYSNLSDINEFKRYVRLVEIIDKQNYIIRLGLVGDNSLNALILESSVHLKLGNKVREVSFFIYV